MKKFETKVLLTSPKIEGKRYTFKPGDVVEEKYLTPDKIEAYLKSGIIKEVAEDTVTPVVKPAKVRSSGLHPKKKGADEDKSEGEDKS